jgi:hypothetical protein
VQISLMKKKNDTEPFNCLAKWMTLWKCMNKTMQWRSVFENWLPTNSRQVPIIANTIIFTWNSRYFYMCSACLIKSSLQNLQSQFDKIITKVLLITIRLTQQLVLQNRSKTTIDYRIELVAYTIDYIIDSLNFYLWPHCIQ